MNATEKKTKAVTEPAPTTAVAIKKKKKVPGGKAVAKTAPAAAATGGDGPQAVAKRHQNTEPFMGVKLPQIRAMALRGGVMLISKKVLEHFRDVEIPEFVKKVVNYALVYREDGRKKIEKQHVMAAFRKMGIEVFDQ